MVAADAQTAVTFSLSPGHAGDAPEGRKLLQTFENMGWEGTKVIMDKAYEGDETRQLVFNLGMEPVVPPKSNRISPWEYDKEIYKKRNEAERLHAPSALPFLYVELVAGCLRDKDKSRNRMVCRTTRMGSTITLGWLVTNRRHRQPRSISIS